MHRYAALSAYVALLSGCSQITYFPESKPLPYQAFASVNANDIVQGREGDCWLLATLGAVADRDPHFLEQSITTDGDSNYAVRFYAGEGQSEQYVNVTFSDLQSGLNLLSEQSNTSWPAMFEIAAIKFNNQAKLFSGKKGDDGITGGVPFEAVSFVTGHPTQFQYGDSWSEFVGQRTGNPTIMCTNSQVSDTSLIPDHCYWVISIDRQHLVLGNPWGLSINLLGSNKLLENFYYRNYVNIQ